MTTQSKGLYVHRVVRVTFVRHVDRSVGTTSHPSLSIHFTYHPLPSVASLRLPHFRKEHVSPTHRLISYGRLLRSSSRVNKTSVAIFLASFPFE